MKTLVVHVSLCLLWTSTASAQPGATTLTAGKLGCTQCSPPQDQQRAQELFQKAKSFLGKAQYGDAAALYEQALTHWDNPLIRYALARALYLERRFLEAHVHVTEVLTYGAACFDPRMWEHVQKLASFLQESLADMGKIEILCRNPGALVDVDGMPGFVCSEPMAQARATCPNPEARVQLKSGWTITRFGEASRFVHPGTYRITASKAGHDTVARPVVVAAGHTSRVAIDLAMAGRKHDRPEKLVSVQMTFWPVLVPRAREHGRQGSPFAGWFMVGSGATALGLGATLHSTAGEATSEAKASYVIGGATAFTGLALLFFHYSRDHPRETRDGSGIAVRPLITGDSAGAVVDFTF
jgi:hypothetical protein